MRSDRVTIAMCFATAILEGMDIISMGLAAPMVVRAFGFAPQEIGLILTAAIVGMMGGAMAGGRAGDRFGRKRVLIVALALVGVFSLATTLATRFDHFVLLRFFCGLGLGAALPNLVAIVAESTGEASRSTSVSFVLAGQPVGGSLLGLFIAGHAGTVDWRTIFFLGGLLPLALLPAIALVLPESRAFLAARQEAAPGRGIIDALFGDRRAPISLLLWISYGFTQVVVYLINNWLPTLMVAKGFTPRDAALLSSIENMGAVAGCIALALMIDRGRIRQVMPVTYVMMVISIIFLSQAAQFEYVAIAGILVGFFVVGGQLVLYSVAPTYYPTPIRATGVGSAISAGRLGAISGPFAAGELLAAGMTPQAVLLAASPCLAIAGLAVTRLVFGFQPAAAPDRGTVDTEDFV